MIKKLVSRAQFARLAGVSGAAVTKACASALKPATEGRRVDAAHPLAVTYVQEKTQPILEPAVMGLDVVYEEAIQFCEEQGYISITSIQRRFKIGYVRAKKIVDTMGISGIAVGKTRPPETAKPAKKPHVRGTSAAREKKKAATVSNNEDADPIQIPQNIQAFLDFTLIQLIEQFGTDMRFVDWLNATQKIEGINEKRLKNAAAEGKLISRNLVEKGVIDTFNSAHLRLLKDGAKSIAAGVISKHAGGSELAEIELFITDILGSFIKPVKSKVVRILKDA